MSNDLLIAAILTYKLSVTHPKWGALLAIGQVVGENAKLIIANPLAAGTQTITGGLTLTGGLTTGGPVTVPDASGYMMNFAGAPTWGTYWDAAQNQIHFHGGGVSKGYVDLDDGVLAGFSAITAANTVTTANFAVPGVAANGYRFWGSDNYKIYMSASADATWGGRIAGETTSDYNTYFRMSGATNRGFVFIGDTTTGTAAAQARLFGIHPNGVRSTVPLAVTSNAAAATLIGTDHVFLALYPRGLVNGRKAYFGFSSGGSTNLTLRNEDTGSLDLVTSSDVINLMPGTVQVASVTSEGLIVATGKKVESERLDVKSSATAKRFKIEFNETDDTLDFTFSDT